jgi:hypothetical protein
MPNRILDISNYSIKSGDVFFFDNNIWMYIFCPIANYKKNKSQKTYSKFFDYALQSKAQLAINSLVISEFSHSCTRLAFNFYKNLPENLVKPLDFKRDYVGSEDYKINVKAILVQVKEILSVTTKYSDEFHIFHQSNIFEGFEDLGFNDCYYGEQSSKKSWILVTDDKDFKKLPPKNLTILTNN